MSRRTRILVLCLPGVIVAVGAIMLIAPSTRAGRPAIKGHMLTEIDFDGWNSQFAHPTLATQ